MKISVEVPDQLLIDILTTAVEGGIAYWANDFNAGHGNDITRNANGDVEAFHLGDPIKGSDVDGITVHNSNVRIEDLAYALHKHGSKFPHILSDVLSENYDSNTADALVQLVVFDDIVFG